MKVLVVGSGGREHALAWKFAQSERVETVFVAPGNAGSALEQGIKNIEIGSTDVEGLVNFAGREGIGITVIGPEVRSIWVLLIGSEKRDYIVSVQQKQPRS